jgi:hypothetical protein
MIRALTLAAAVAAFAAPAFAEDAATTDADATAAIRAQLAFESGALQARQHLVHQGYVNISALERDGNGHWVGSALKDGKVVYVAVKLPLINPVPASTN